jgi:phage-related minor tail protein
MPSFEDPQADAEEMRQAARGLAHATRRIDTPGDMYDVFGSVTYTVTALTQALNQIAAWHQTHADRAAHDNGDRAAGRTDALEVARRLRTATERLDGVIDEVMAAHSANGRIAWQPEPTPDTSLTREEFLTEALTRREAALDPDSATRLDDSGPGRGLSR